MGNAKISETFGARHTDAGLRGVIGFLGQPGVGKTYRMQKILTRVRRCVYFDTPGNVGRGVRQNPMPGWFEIWSYADFVQFMRVNGRKQFRVVYHPGEKCEDEFHALCKLVFALRDCVFAVDEVWEFCKPNWMPDSLKRMAFRGRHPGITLIWTAQRAALVAAGLRSVTSSYYVFRQQEDDDLEALRGRIPAPALAAVPSLPDRAFIYRDESMNWKLNR